MTMWPRASGKISTSAASAADGLLPAEAGERSVAARPSSTAASSASKFVRRLIATMPPTAFSEKPSPSWMPGKGNSANEQHDQRDRVPVARRLEDRECPDGDEAEIQIEGAEERAVRTGGQHARSARERQDELRGDAARRKRPDVLYSESKRRAPADPEWKRRAGAVDPEPDRQARSLGAQGERDADAERRVRWPVGQQIDADVVHAQALRGQAVRSERACPARVRAVRLRDRRAGRSQSPRAPCRRGGWRRLPGARPPATLVIASENPSVGGVPGATSATAIVAPMPWIVRLGPPPGPMVMGASAGRRSPKPSEPAGPAR